MRLRKYNAGDKRLIVVETHPIGRRPARNAWKLAWRIRIRVQQRATATARRTLETRCSTIKDTVLRTKLRKDRSQAKVLTAKLQDASTPLLFLWLLPSHLRLWGRRHPPLRCPFHAQHSVWVSGISWISQLSSQHSLQLCCSDIGALASSAALTAPSPASFSNTRGVRYHTFHSETYSSKHSSANLLLKVIDSKVILCSGSISGRSTMEGVLISLALIHQKKYVAANNGI